MNVCDAAASVRVRFSGATPSGRLPEQQRNSYCASGYIFRGSMQLCSADGREILHLPVQSGGWMCEDSPFRRAGLCPAAALWGEYDPLHFPDTAFPALPEPTVLGTLRTGRLCGFRVPDPPGTGRSFLMVHASTRYGSEGCITCPAGDDWELFCSYMAQLHASGVQSIPLHVIYDCPPPDPTRCRIPAPHHDPTPLGLPPKC